VGAALPPFPLLNESVDIIAPTATLPFWQGSSVVNLRFDMSDGSVKIMQMSKEYARSVALALLNYCKE
jgi:hypothetical protein